MFNSRIAQTDVTPHAVPGTTVKVIEVFTGLDRRETSPGADKIIINSNFPTNQLGCPVSLVFVICLSATEAFTDGLPHSKIDVPPKDIDPN